MPFHRGFRSRQIPECGVEIVKNVGNIIGRGRVAGTARGLLSFVRSCAFLNRKADYLLNFAVVEQLEGLLAEAPDRAALVVADYGADRDESHIRRESGATVGSGDNFV